MPKNKPIKTSSRTSGKQAKPGKKAKNNPRHVGSKPSSNTRRGTRKR